MVKASRQFPLRPRRLVRCGKLSDNRSWRRLKRPGGIVARLPRFSASHLQHSTVACAITTSKDEDSHRKNTDDTDRLLRQFVWGKDAVADYRQSVFRVIRVCLWPLTACDRFCRDRFWEETRRTRPNADICKQRFCSSRTA